MLEPHVIKYIGLRNAAQFPVALYIISPYASLERIDAIELLKSQDIYNLRPASYI